MTRMVEIESIVKSGNWNTPVSKSNRLEYPLQRRLACRMIVGLSSTRYVEFDFQQFVAYHILLLSAARKRK